MKTSFWKGKRVAVTGANGFIGSRAVMALEQSEALVRAVVSGEKSVRLFPKNVTVVSANLCNPNEARIACKDQDVVFHFAALDGGHAFKRTHELDMLRTNMRITETVLDAVQEQKVSRLFLMSSIDVYPSVKEGIIPETFGSTNWFYETLPGYSWAKRFMEIMAKYYQSPSLGIAIARVGNVYGANDDFRKGRAIPSFIQSAKNGTDITITASKNQKIPFIHVDDLIPRLMKLTEVYAVCDPVNILGDEALSLYDLAQCVIRVCNSRSRLLYAPETKARAIYSVSNRKARKIIGDFPSRSIEQGITDVLKEMEREEKNHD